ncbi:MAG: GH3 auxin-responsive promoter family protein [bacterium]|nr:GH3 auxin-responsive promoter family protein [bacterium]
MIGYLANSLWTGGNLGRWHRFRRALHDPGRVQRRILARCLRSNAETLYGRRHGFAGIDSPDEFQRRVPLSVYDDYVPLVDRIRDGEQGVLTREPVLRLMPSSGSTAARKLIPLTRSFLAELQRGIGPWIVDLYRRHPRLKRGTAYWSISPAIATPDGEPSAVPIGFDDDSAYLGGLFQWIVERTLAVPGEVRHLAELEDFGYATLLHLLRARHLSLISVWHPSFLTLLLEPLERYWDRLLDDVAGGTVSLPGGNPPFVPLRGNPTPALTRRLRPDRRRAEELRPLGPGALRAVWPRLGMISCWTDGHAEGAAAALRDRFPGVSLVAKGLVATEAFVSLPFAGARPLAVCSHFFELLDADGRPHLADELRAGGEYSVVVTTGGGLYRYRLQDRVRVESFLGATPCVRFLGKEDRISDRCGEKLSDGHVASVLRQVLEPLELGVRFAMLAPDEEDGTVGYTLYLESQREPPGALAAQIERALCENPHYRYCAALGQLAPARVFRVREAADKVYLEHRCRSGQRLGDVKPVALSSDGGWTRRFEGHYLDAESPPGL